MLQPKWIWYPGDFEIYHSNLVHSRREDFGMEYPPVWMQYSPYPRVDCRKSVKCDEERTITVHTNPGTMGMVTISGFPRHFAVNAPITLPAGEYELHLRLYNTTGLPSCFIDDVYYGTDESWRVSNGSFNYVQAAATPAYTTPEKTPDVFAFSYDEIQPVAVEAVAGGVLYDFGKENFGPVCIGGLDPADTAYICYGESREEALDWENAYVHQTVSGAKTVHLVPRAFRYIHVRCGKACNLTLRARYEYLPLRDIADFSCDDPMVEKIWDVCAYTFHLNSREFFQDGIKRDRWVWSGDSYQSFMTNNYLYMDPEITKRTILALLGKPPYEQHVNTINDYTLYLIISLWDYYFSTGDADFVRLYWPRFKALYAFVLGRLDEDGQMVQRPGDWIFIDWSEMDKSGPLCAEQILLWRTALSMASLAVLCGEAAEPYREQATALKKLIDERYWDAEKHAYIDCCTSGKRSVTRHANIFAILYDFADETRKAELMEHVLDNDAITQITTPYFKFFELCARCSMGDLASAQKLIASYWGGMIKNGATSIWEQFVPEAKGAEHYAMYGTPYGCSLCHAWGGGPIYLLGRYCLGVSATDVGYKTFRVQPDPGIYSEIHGIVPLPEGLVRIDYKDGVLKVFTDRDGGTLCVRGTEYPLISGLVSEIHCTL